MVRKYAIKGAVGLLLVSLIIWGKAFYLQYDHYRTAEQYHADSQWKLAIREYGLAMHMYTPWSPYVEKAAQRLWQIGETHEKEGRPDWAIIAYSTLRSSLHASRSFYTPGKEWIEKCNARIARLSAGSAQSGEQEPTKAQEHERALLLSALRADGAPTTGWSLLASSSLLGWIGAIVLLVFRGYQGNGRFASQRRASWGIALFLVTFVMWMGSLYLA
jgi:hypothetical protein